MYSAEPLPHFVDEYLSYLYEVHPTNASFDGVHLHDDLLEDWSRASIETQIRDLGGFARRLAAIDPARLTDTERLERPALDASIRARLMGSSSSRIGSVFLNAPRTAIGVPRTAASSISSNANAAISTGNPPQADSGTLGGRSWQSPSERPRKPAATSVGPSMASR